jgi:hypothetical protein
MLRARQRCRRRGHEEWVDCVAVRGWRLAGQSITMCVTFALNWCLTREQSLNWYIRRVESHIAAARSEAAVKRDRVAPAVALRVLGGTGLGDVQRLMSNEAE